MTDKCRPWTGEEGGWWAWHCRTHDLGNYGCATPDDAETAADEHARQFKGLS